MNIDLIPLVVGAVAIYGLATILRGERWHWILAITGVRDCPIVAAASDAVVLDFADEDDVTFVDIDDDDDSRSGVDFGGTTDV